MLRRLRIFMLAALSGFVVPASAAASAPAPATSDDDRAHVATERREMLKRYDSEERACRERFVVTACVDDVRVRRRHALAPLRERELQSDDAQRRRRAQQRQSGRDAKAVQAASAAPAVRASEPASRPAQSIAGPRREAVSSTASSPASKPAPGREATRRPHDDGAETRATVAAERARAQADRVQQVQQAQAEIARRQAERLRNPKRSAALPAPPGSGAASAAR